MPSGAISEKSKIEPICLRAAFDFNSPTKYDMEHDQFHCVVQTQMHICKEHSIAENQFW